MFSATPVVALAADLLSRPSITPKDEGCQDLLAARLKPLGFNCESLAFGEGASRVENLWALRQVSASAPLLVFAGHTDVVPTGEGWSSPPFNPTVRLNPAGEESLYGRGAVDMKAALAAMVVAVESYLSSASPHLNIGFLFTSDEEDVAINGTVKVCEVLQQRGIKPDYCIIGEPTSDKVFGDIIKNGRRGSLSARLTIKGVQGHIAYPEKVDNPIHRSAPVLAALVKKAWDSGNQDFPPTSWQVSNIHGGTGAGNVVPGSVVIDCNFRFSTESTVDSLKAAFVEVLGKVDPQMKYDLSWHVGALPFISSNGRLVQAVKAAIESETGRPTSLSTGGGTSDGRFISRICPEVLEVGLLNNLAHKVDEHAPVSDISQLQNIYLKIVQQLAG